MKKIVRNMSTAKTKSFWKTAERDAIEVEQWPAWKRAGINVAQLRQEARDVSVESSSSKRAATVRKG